MRGGAMKSCKIFFIIILLMLLSSFLYAEGSWHPGKTYWPRTLIDSSQAAIDYVRTRVTVEPYLSIYNTIKIKSDVDLESLINDRFSFKKFIGLPMGEAAPDSSTFSRLRKRLTLEKYNRVLSDISDQISRQNLIINMGSIMDIQVIKSNRPSKTKT